MVALLFRRLALLAFAALLVLDALSRFEPPQQLPLVQADYQSCVTIRTGPIQRPDGYTSQPFGHKPDVA